MKYTLILERDEIELWGFGIKLDNDEARRVIRHISQHYGENSIEVLKEITRILGEHDGDPMSSAPSRAAEIAREELARLGVHEQEMRTRRPTVIGRG